MSFCYAPLGAERVFMDVSDIQPGQNFEQTIDGGVATGSGRRVAPVQLQ